MCTRKVADEVAYKVLIYVCSRLKAQKDENENLFYRNLEDMRGLCRMIDKAGGFPVCPPLYLTQFMDDFDPDDRARALQICEEAVQWADCILINAVKGISDGMEREQNVAIENNIDQRIFHEPVTQLEIDEIVSYYKDIKYYLGGNKIEQ